MAHNSRTEVKYSHLPSMPAQVADAADAIVEAAANQVLAQIRATAPVKGMPVTLKRGRKSITVVVGSSRVFYAGFVEYGTVDQAARPFVTPSAEAHKQQFLSDMRHLESRLRV
jgi:HK97 gp10 family phage protein